MLVNVILDAHLRGHDCCTLSPFGFNALLTTATFTEMASHDNFESLKMLGFDIIHACSGNTTFCAWSENQVH